MRGWLGRETGHSGWVFETGTPRHSGDDYLSNIGKGVASDQLADLTTAGLHRYYRASLYTVIGDPIIETLTIAVSKNTNVDRYIVTAATAGFLLRDWVPESLHGVGRTLFGKTVALNTTFETVERVIGYQFSYAHHLPAGRVAGKILASKLGLHLLDAGIGFGIDVGYQILLDFNNPYLTSKQILQRAVVGQGSGSIVSFIGGGLAGAAFGGPVGFVVGVSISIIWDITITPIIYEWIGAVPTRDLAPLSP